MNNPHSRGWTIEGGRSQGRLAFLSVFFAIFQLLSSIFAPRAQAQTSVLFPLQQMFGSMNYALPFTIATTNTSITGNGNLYVGQTLIVTPAGTNPIVQLTPNVYSLTFQDGQFPLYFTVPSTNVVVNVINLITNGLSTFPSWSGGGGGSSIGYITQVAGAQNTNLIVASGFGTGNANGLYTNLVPGLAWTNMALNGFNIQPGLLGSWMIASNAVQYYYGGGTDPISTEGAYHNQFAAGAGPAFQPVLWGNYYSQVTNYINGQAVLQGGTNVTASGSGSAIVFSVPPNTFDPAGAAAAVGATAITATTQPLSLANGTITVDILGYTALNGYAVQVNNLYATGTNITGIPIPNLISNGLPVAPVAGQVATFTSAGLLVASNAPSAGGANSNTFTGSLNIGQLYGGIIGATATNSFDPTNSAFNALKQATNSFQPTNASLSLWAAFTPASYGLIASNSFDPTNSAFNALKQATNSFQPTNANLSLWSATTPAAFGLVISNSFDATNAAFNALKQGTNSFQPQSQNLTNWSTVATNIYVSIGTLAQSNFMANAASNTLLAMAGALISGSNYVTNITATAGSTNFLGTLASGAEVSIPWSGLPTGGGSTANTIQTNAAGFVAPQVGLTNAANIIAGSGTNLTGIQASNVVGAVPASLVPTNAAFFNGNTIGITNSVLSVGTNGFGGGSTTANTVQTNANGFVASQVGLTNAANILSGQLTNNTGTLSGFFVGNVYITNLVATNPMLLPIPAAATTGWVWTLTNTATGQGTWSNAAAGTTTANTVQTNAGGAITIPLTNSSFANFAGPVTNWGSEVVFGSMTNYGGGLAIGTLGGNVGTMQLADSYASRWDLFQGASNGISLSGNMELLTGWWYFGNGGGLSNLQAAAVTGPLSGSFTTQLFLTNGFSSSNALATTGGSIDTNLDIQGTGFISISNNTQVPTVLIQGSVSGSSGNGVEAIVANVSTGPNSWAGFTLQNQLSQTNQFYGGIYLNGSAFANAGDPPFGSNTLAIGTWGNLTNYANPATNFNIMLFAAQTNNHISFSAGNGVTRTNMDLFDTGLYLWQSMYWSNTANTAGGWLNTNGNTYQSGTNFFAGLVGGSILLTNNSAISNAPMTTGISLNTNGTVGSLTNATLQVIASAAIFTNNVGISNSIYGKGITISTNGNMLTPGTNFSIGFVGNTLLLTNNAAVSNSLMTQGWQVSTNGNSSQTGTNTATSFQGNGNNLTNVNTTEIHAIIPLNAATSYAPTTNWFAPESSSTNLGANETYAASRPAVTNFWLAGAAFTLFCNASPVAPTTNITVYCFTNHQVCAAATVQFYTVAGSGYTNMSTNWVYNPQIPCINVTNYSFCLSNSAVLPCNGSDLRYLTRYQ